MDNSLSGIPRGGMCVSCSVREEGKCVDEEAVGGCIHFNKTNLYSKSLYFGGPEPILNSHGYQYLEVSQEGDQIFLKEFGEYVCQRCEHTTFIKQGKGKLIEPFECESDVCGRKGPFKKMFPTEIMRPAWKTPTGIIPTESPQVLFDVIVDFLKNSIYFQEDIQYYIFALWIMASWVPESFESCPYLMFIAPKDSGKTRGLDIISEIGYRVIPAVSFSGSSVFRSVDLWHCTLLVDEAEYQLNPKSEKGQDLYGILNGGYKRGMYAIRTETFGDALIPTVFDIFGFKAIAATRAFNPTLESRSIIFHMEQHEIKNLVLPKEECEEIRNRLLYFRYSTLKKLKLVFPKQLKKGRIIEIYHPIYTLASLVDPELIKKLDIYIETTYQQTKAEDKVSLPEADIIRAIQDKFDDIDNKEMVVYIKDIVDYVKYDFPDSSSQQVGYLLKAMGFTREKDRRGMLISLADDNNKLKFDMYKERFGI